MSIDQVLHQITDERVYGQARTVTLLPADFGRLRLALLYEMGRQLTSANFAELVRDRRLADRCTREYEELVYLCERLFGESPLAFEARAAADVFADIKALADVGGEEPCQS